ncbi:MAG: AEC family transporter [candidate division Zixibacteria bacterium]|nr:AEC family transporter [candidate division Zixibacteria bacterium]
MIFLDILLGIIAPIFVLILIGYYLEKKYTFDVQVLTKILLYLVMPATIVTTLSGSTLSSNHLETTVVFCLVMIGVLFALSLLCSLMLRHGREKTRAFGLSVMFYNSGNFGFPASDLAFPGLGLAIQVIVLGVQNVINFTFGIFLVSAGRFPVWEAVRKTLSMPFVYALLLVVVIRFFDIRLPSMIGLPLKYLSGALIPMALLALGIQLGKTRVREEIGHSIVSVICRLIISPVIGFVLALVMKVDPQIAPILVLSTSYPTAINTALIAMEIKNEEAFAANAVFLSTIWSALTVAVVLFAVRGYWPVP